MKRSLIGKTEAAHGTEMLFGKIFTVVSEYEVSLFNPN
jgi:hypothetical protein